MSRAIHIMNKNARKSALKTKVNYETWSKEELIKKLRSLEGAVLNQVGLNSKNKDKEFSFSKFNTRFIALKFSYLGWNYNGLSYQYDPTPLPTVEEVILDAMVKAKLIPSSDPTSCNFSRCGRTDKGVSALRQVISLNVRSNLSKEEQGDRSMDERELPYLTILNALLPQDIRMAAVCLRPPEGFDARFSCLYRHYKYIFSGEGLDIENMNRAASLFEGEHDFRNFCKVDGSKQITNHKRLIHSAKILPIKEKMFVFDLKGSAFLWHQVRCMVAVLFLVGQGLEKPDVVQNLVNIEKLPSRPLYDMAHDIPLVLYDCVYPDMEWLKQARDFGSSQAQKLLKECRKFQGIILDHKIKSLIVDMMGEAFIDRSLETSQCYTNLGDGIGRAFKKYIPIKNRPLSETVEQHNAKFLEKKKRKLEQISLT